MPDLYTLPVRSSAVEEVIKRRSATNFFDAGHSISEQEIRELADLATRAPSAFNLQNWRIDAVCSPDMKKRLRAAAFNQAKAEEAAVTFVISGELGSAEPLRERLKLCVQEGSMTDALAEQWVQMAADTYEDGQRARDEAVRSATLAAAMLMLAAEGRGWATAPMSGFDPARIQALLELGPTFMPVMLLAVGARIPGNWAQKPRRPLTEVLRLA